jgi:transcriptional regulator with XRE-family HTH domain
MGVMLLSICKINTDEGYDTMLNVDKIQVLLLDRRLDIIGGATGLHRNTLSAIRDGKNRNPSYETICKLSDYFQRDVALRHNTTGGGDDA